MSFILFPPLFYTAPSCPLGPIRGKIRTNSLASICFFEKRRLEKHASPLLEMIAVKERKLAKILASGFALQPGFCLAFPFCVPFFFLRHPGYGYKSRVMSYNTQCPTFKALETSQWLTAEGGSLTLRRVWNLTGYSSSVLLFCLWHKTRFPIKPRYAQWGSGAQGRRGGKGALFCVWPVPSSPRGPNLELACLEMSGN